MKRVPSRRATDFLPLPRRQPHPRHHHVFRLLGRPANSVRSLFSPERSLFFFFTNKNNTAAMTPAERTPSPPPNPPSFPLAMVGGRAQPGNTRQAFTPGVDWDPLIPTTIPGLPAHPMDGFFDFAFGTAPPARRPAPGTAAPPGPPASSADALPRRPSPEENRPARLGLPLREVSDAPFPGAGRAHSHPRGPRAPLPSLGGLYGRSYIHRDGRIDFWSSARMNDWLDGLFALSGADIREDIGSAAAPPGSAGGEDEGEDDAERRETSAVSFSIFVVCVG